MLILALIWLAIGLLVGVLATVAQLQPLSWGRRAWLMMPGIGVVGGQAGGWIGALLLGRYFGTATALWFAVLLVTLTPRLIVWINARLRFTGTGNTAS
jgi:hypothetical protein